MNSSHRIKAIFAVATLVATSVALSIIGSVVASAQIKVAVNGNWSATATWVGGVVPGASDNVVVDSGLAVTIDVTDAVCNDLTANGYVLFNEAVTNNALTVNGNLTVGQYGRLRSSTGGTITGPRVQHLTLMKNLTVETGGSLDFRMGSNPNVSVGRLVFAGSSNSEIRLARTTYSSSGEEFNSVVIDKSGGAKVILAAGNLFQNNNSSNSPDTLVLINGIIETQGTSIWVHLATSNAAVQGGSSASYVNGTLGRGISNGGTPPITRGFEVGDANGYRKLTVRTQDVGGSTGHYIYVRAISGNANTGTSAFTGGIDKVSSVRYYEVGFFPTAITPMPLDIFIPTYEADDGVASGNQDLRVAYSTDDRATWNGMGQAVNDTTFVPDNAIRPDSLVTASWINLTSSTKVHVALARATGTTTNSLDFTTSVEQKGVTPIIWSLDQNYPNPFNPETEIRFSTLKAGHVAVSVYNILGQRIASLVSTAMEPGTHRTRWNGRDDAGRVMPSGVYIYKLEGPGFVQARRMVLMK